MRGGQLIVVLIIALVSALGELSEAMQRGWSERDCRVAMTLQEERAGVTARAAPDRLRAALEE